MRLKKIKLCIRKADKLVKHPLVMIIMLNNPPVVDIVSKSNRVGE